MYLLPNSASLLMSESCNLNCSYCFEKSKKNVKMTEEVAIKALDFLYNNEIKNRENGFSSDSVGITLFGGEPFLNWDVSKILLDYIKTKNKEIAINVGIITNGTIINQEIVDYLNDYSKSHNISIQISVDGLKETHDFYRVYHDGKGSFDVIEKNIQMFKKIFGEDELKRNKRGSLHLHGSLNKKTVRSMYDSWKYFNEKWKMPVIWMMPIHDEEWDDNDVFTYNEQLTKIANDLLNYCINNKTAQFINDFAPLNKGIKYCFDPLNKLCGAGSSYCTVTANGDIYPCHHFYYFKDSDEIKIGNVYDGVDDNKRLLFSKYDGSDINCYKHNCKNYACYRCLAENYNSTGSILNCKFDKRCEMSSIENRLINNINKILKSEGLINE